MMTLLGTGRVWSEQMMTTFFLPSAMTARVGVPMGAAMAARTSSSGVPAGLYSCMWLSMMPAKRFSGISRLRNSLP